MNKEIKKELINIIDRPIVTDKTTKLLENNQYCFYVSAKANKMFIKKAIEYIFNVKVKKVNTCHEASKQRKVGRFKGYKPHYKKAIVTLEKNNKINLFAE